MTSGRSKCRDFLALVFISKSISKKLLIKINQLYQNIKTIFKLIRKGQIYAMNLILLTKTLVMLLMAPSQKRICTTRTRANDSMAFTSLGVGLGSFCYADFLCRISKIA